MPTARFALRSLLVAGLCTPLIALAQASAAESDAGAAYGKLVTQAVLTGETLILLEARCPALKSNTDYREIVAGDRARVESASPMLALMLPMLVSASVDEFMKKDGGCEDARLKDRHAKLREQFSSKALAIMQGDWGAADRAP